MNELFDVVETKKKLKLEKLKLEGQKEELQEKIDSLNLNFEVEILMDKSLTNDNKRKLALKEKQSDSAELQKYGLELKKIKYLIEMANIEISYLRDKFKVLTLNKELEILTIKNINN